MQLSIEITTGKGDKAITTTHKVDSDDMPLILLEALQEGRAREMREGITDFLDLTPEQARALTVRDVKTIGAALKEASEVPNG